MIDISKIRSSSYEESTNASTNTQDNFTAKKIIEDGKDYAIGKAINASTTHKAINDIVIHSDLYKLALHGSNLFNKDEIDIYNNMYRFGLYNPYGAVTNAREYLFFTKPDLNIIARDSITGSFITQDSNGLLTTNALNESLQSMKFWQEIYTERQNTLKMLQNSYSPGWNMLLQNSVTSNLEIPGIEGTVIDSPVNDYGVGFQYRGTSEASDDSLEFSLEFRDTKWLDVYYFFKAYEEYEILKHHGTVAPWEGYIVNRILHDQFSIYKFMVGDDMETLLYWGKLYGVMPMNLPREVFSTSDFSNGLNYSINFRAAFFEDMRVEILSDFNDLQQTFNQGVGNPGGKYQYETYNDGSGMGDYRPAKSAYIDMFQNPDSPTGYVYKLKWKGDAVY
jgi:hypothetical protein